MAKINNGQTTNSGPTTTDSKAELEQAKEAFKAATDKLREMVGQYHKGGAGAPTIYDCKAAAVALKEARHKLQKVLPPDPKASPPDPFSALKATPLKYETPTGGNKEKNESRYVGVTGMTIGEAKKGEPDTPTAKRVNAVRITVEPKRETRETRADKVIALIDQRIVKLKADIASNEKIRDKEAKEPEEWSYWKNEWVDSPLVQKIDRDTDKLESLKALKEELLEYKSNGNGDPKALTGILKEAYRDGVFNETVEKLKQGMDDLFRRSPK